MFSYEIIKLLLTALVEYNGDKGNHFKIKNKIAKNLLSAIIDATIYINTHNKTQARNGILTIYNVLLSSQIIISKLENNFGGQIDGIVAMYTRKFKKIIYPRKPKIHENTQTTCCDCVSNELIEKNILTSR